MENRLLALFLLFSLASVFFLGLEPLDMGSEGQVLFRNDVERKGFVDVEIGEDVSLEWETEGINKWTHTAPKSSPVITGEGIVVGGDTGKVYLFNREGKAKWSYSIKPSEKGIHGTAAVKDGKVYIGGYDGILYSLDLENGEKIWEKKVGDAIGSSPVLYKGKLYVSVETNEPSGIMTILDPKSGEVMWEDKRITDHPHSSVAISPKADVFTVGSNDGYLYVWELGTRDFKGRFKTNGDIKGPIAVDGTNAVFGSWDQNVYSVNLSKMRLDWYYQTDDDVMSAASIGKNGDVYIGSHDTKFYSLNGSNGEKIWSIDTDGWITGSPTLVENAVLFGSKDDHLYAVNKTNGDLIWEYESSGDVTSAPAVTENGKVIFTDRATDSETGSILMLDTMGK